MAFARCVAAAEMTSLFSHRNARWHSLFFQHLTDQVVINKSDSGLWASRKRRVALRASLHTLGLYLLAVGLLPSSVLWEADRASAQTTEVAAATASDDEAACEPVQQWLARTRQAISEGRWTLAEYCIQSAERLAADLPASVALEVSPAAVRAELAAAHGSTPAAASDATAPTPALANVSDSGPLDHLRQARRALAAGDVAAAQAAVARRSRATWTSPPRPTRPRGSKR